MDKIKVETYDEIENLYVKNTGLKSFNYCIEEYNSLFVEWLMDWIIELTKDQK